MPFQTLLGLWNQPIKWKSRIEGGVGSRLAQNERKMVYFTHLVHKFDNFRAMQKFLLILCGQFWYLHLVFIHPLIMMKYKLFMGLIFDLASPNFDWFEGNFTGLDCSHYRPKSSLLLGINQPLTVHSTLRVIQPNLQKTWKRLSWHCCTYSRGS